MSGRYEQKKENLCGLDLRKELREKRKQIDRVDRNLLHLLNERLRIAQELGAIKEQKGERIHDPVREKEILERLAGENKGPLKATSLEEIFRTIIRVCRKSQS